MQLGYITIVCTKCHMVKAIVASLKLSSPETLNETEDTWLKIRTGRFAAVLSGETGQHRTLTSTLWSMTKLQRMMMTIRRGEGE